MDKLTQSLKQCEPFNRFSDDAMARLQSNIDARNYQAGEAIINKNRDFNVVHYLVEGSIELRTSFFEREEFTDTDPQARKPLEDSAAPGVAVNASSECTIVRFFKSEIEAAEATPTIDADKPQAAHDGDDWMERFLLSPLVGHLDANDISQLDRKSVV